MLDARTTSGVHEAEVARLVQAYAALPPGAPVRLAKRTSNLFRFRDATADAAAGLDVSAFGHVLSVDPVTRTARVGGMTTYEDLCDATLPHQLMPLVVPQLKTITLGGAVTGLGIESTSLRNGMPHESVTALEILTGDGRVVVATDDNEHADLFRGFPNSYGTLGYSLSLTIELEPVRPYVHLRHFPFDSAEACMEAVSQIAAEGRYRGHKADFVDGTAFAPDELYLTVGAYSDVAPWRSDYTGQQIYYQSVRQGQGGLPHHPRLPVALGHRLVLVLTAIRSTETAGQEAVAAPLPALGRVQEAGRPGPPLRPDRRADAEAAPPVPGGGDPGRGDPSRTRCRVPAVFCGKCGDESGMDVPAAAARRALLAPLPAQARRGVRELRVLGDRAAARGSTGPGRRLLQPPRRGRGRQLGGHKSLYSTSFYPEDEFYELYNGEAYRALKRAYDGEGRLLGLYEKCVRGADR